MPFPSSEQRQSAVSTLAHEILSFPEILSGTEIACNSLPSTPQRIREPKLLTLPNGMVFGTQYQSSNLRIICPDGQVFYYHSGGKPEYDILKQSSYATPGTYLKIKNQNTNESKIFFYGSKKFEESLKSQRVFSSSERRILRSGNELFIKEQCILDELAEPDALEKERQKAAIYGNITDNHFSGYLERECVIDGHLTPVAEVIRPYPGLKLDALLQDRETPLTIEERLVIAKNCLAHLCLLHEGKLSQDGQPIVHGNLNLENICVNPATFAVSFVEYTTHYEHVISGYRAPELANRSSQLSPSFKTDIYALGAIFKGNSLDEIRTAKKTGGMTILNILDKGLLKITQEEWAQASKKTREEYTEMMKLSQEMMNPNPQHRPQLDRLKMACGLGSSQQTLNEIIQLIKDSWHSYHVQESRKNLFGRFLGIKSIQLPLEILHPKNIMQLRNAVIELCEDVKTPIEFVQILLHQLSRKPALEQALALPELHINTPRSLEGSRDTDDEIAILPVRKKGSEVLELSCKTAKSLFNPFSSSRLHSVTPVCEDDENILSN